jgi:hypothetical protein
MCSRDACGRPDLDGLSAFVYKCAEANIELGAKLLMAITPRTADIAVRREVEVSSMQRKGLPKSSEIFRVEWGSAEDIALAEENTIKK